VGCHFVGQNCVSVGSTVLNGSAGGMGGTGGTGALGGGGAGGDSWCYYAGPNAKVSASGWSCTPVSPGKGGNQNQANQGANGNAGMHN